MFSETTEKQLPDLDTYLQLIGFSFIKESSMCQGKKTTLIYKREKPNKMTIQLILDKGDFLEGVNIEAG